MSEEVNLNISKHEWEMVLTKVTSDRITIAGKAKGHI